jgi:hypothetical protein
MWTWILNLIRQIFGRPASPAGTPSATTTTPAPPAAPPSAGPGATALEAPTHRDIDWANNPPDYRKQQSVLTYYEREFYRLLQRQFGQEYHILAMVRLGDVLWLAKEAQDRKFFSNQIQCKHLDFVFCDRLKTEPVLAIELDDSSHHWQSRWERDQFKDKACERAELPLLRFKAQSQYDRDEITRQIRQRLANGAKPSQE